MAQNDTLPPLQRNVAREWARRMVGMGYEVAQRTLAALVVAVVWVVAQAGQWARAWRWLAGAQTDPPTPHPAPNERKGGGTSYLHLSPDPQVARKIPGQASPQPGVADVWAGMLDKQAWAALGDEWLPPQERGVPIPTASESAPRKISQEISGQEVEFVSVQEHVDALREIAVWFHDRSQPTRGIQCERAADLLELLT